MDKEEVESKKYDEEEGETERYPTPKSSSIFDDTTRALTHSEAGECLHMLGKCESGLGYAYLCLNASNKGLTDIRVIPMFKYVLYVDVSGNRLTTEALRYLTSMKYLLMIRADRNHVTSGELEPMPYLQVLTLNKNKLTSTSGISHKQLECLELNHNNIEEVTLNPYDLENLKHFELRGNILTTTNGIFFPRLTRLFLAENQIEKLEGLEILVNLTTLHLRSNKLSNLTGFDSRCVKLNYLNLRNNEIIKLSELEKLSCLPALETLVILENPTVPDREAEEEVAYRHIVLAMLPNLTRIDKDPVLFDEKREAKEFRRQMLRDGTKFPDLDTNPPN
ncbi:Leucine-rich repeat-containing protein 23 [Habropoda laboriosa]|uniref:Leucine-rich repeat-containing protein 23 n=1 Tax=Habropoda laboriosa TaxID=597456 RepID=A0A0L7R5H1_9HYME|nr:PREDICTED: leucine-rich repeat-containing protein 23-like [Habropoda laboriosa]KOC66130.1 Leucine-rich repeat-containing protein 23 [Habropoda laboriosa]